MPMPGPLELVLILVIVAMLFGVGKLPEVFGAVGKGIREFRKESTLESDVKQEAEKQSSDAVETAENRPAA
ncbi:MAG: twin-arginine translocase TatA/TatE family subunit [Caldilineaceae bacterium]|nr:twin-arginine translocase TatA/TatE family subunit [Caldilineaceae bacterium]